MVDDGVYITGEAAQSVHTIGRPIGMAVSAQVDSQCITTGGGERRRRTAPGMPCLSTTVQQHDRRTLVVTERIGHEIDPFATQRQGSRFDARGHPLMLPAALDQPAVGLRWTLTA